MHIFAPNGDYCLFIVSLLYQHGSHEFIGFHILHVFLLCFEFFRVSACLLNLLSCILVVKT